jgi:hypothetical protein
VRFRAPLVLVPATVVGVVFAERDRWPDVKHPPAS